MNTIMQAHHLCNTADFRNHRTINPQHLQEVQYWAGEFDVPPSKLIEVVREVGRNLTELRKRFSI